MNRKKRALKRQEAKLNSSTLSVNHLTQPHRRITIEFVPNSIYDYKYYKKSIEMSGATVTDIMEESYGY